jgi:hypothetical protein
MQRDSKKTNAASFAAIEKNLIKAFQKKTEQTDDLSSAQHRLALRTAQTLQGLLAVKALFERGGSAEELGKDLHSLIERTRFQEQQVLKEYAPQLYDIFSRKDRLALEKLLGDVTGRLNAFAKDDIIRDNLAALSSREPQALLKDVVREIKRGGTPSLSLEPQRVLDLLG